MHNDGEAAHIESLVVQRYLENPFLLDGRKFDYRCYLLITTSFNSQKKNAGCKMISGFLHNGYVRSAGLPYNTTVSDTSWGAHITNFSVQKQVLVLYTSVM